jgi:hypothetical protein
LGFFIHGIGENGVAQKLISFLKFLFQNVQVMVCFDGGIIKPFKMKGEVKQGCPLAPYLFILMGEIFNFMVKDVMRVGKIERIST